MSLEYQDMDKSRKEEILFTFSHFPLHCEVTPSTVSEDNNKYSCENDA
jgi:hypothetical protein